MKKSIISILLMLIPLFPAFSQDNVSGDYFMAVSQKLISLDLESASLVDVLKMLSQQTGLNFITTEAVRDRKLTLYLEGTPLKEALDVIFKANNLTYDYYPDANMFTVKEMGKPAIELRTKVYRLRYARVFTSAMVKEIEDKMRPKDATTTAGSGGAAGGAAGASSAEGGAAQQAKGLQYVIKKILTEFGKITEDAQTNSLIVTDVPSQFATIDEVIASLDVSVPKVLIEVEMLDVNKSLADQIGVTYGDSGLVGNFTLGSMLTPFPFPSRLINTIPQQAMPGSLANIPDRISQMSVLNLSDIRIILQLLKTDTTTKFLARPKILTLSDETAEVNLTTNEAIGVTTASSTTGGGTLTQTVERTETGTKLRVTPHVNAYTKEVTLFVEVFNKQATATTMRLSGMTTGNVMNPEERGTRVVMRLKDGETLLIGGLIRNNDSTTITKIPFFGDIPLIGQAFRHKNKSDTKRELMVFLTPRVVDDSPVLVKRESMVQREQDSFQRESIRVAMDRASREY